MKDAKNDLFTEESLKPGDILFTMSNGEAGHASIYLGSKDGSKLTTAHVVNSGQYQQLMKTSLPAAEYVVYRCKDAKMAELAAHMAENWASYHTPYDEQRLEIGTKVSNVRTQKSAPENRSKDATEACRKDFENTGKYRLVKYAARRGSSINLPEGKGKGRGVWCAMFALMCYQTAAVTKAGLVKPVVGDGEHRWVSDKYSNPKETKAYFESTAPKKSHIFKYAKYKKSENDATTCYENYVDKIRGKGEFQGHQHKDFHKEVVKDHESYSPSIIAWDFAKHGDIQNFDFKAVLSDGLMLEQKTTDPEVFMQALSQDKSMWENLNEQHGNKLLSVANKTATPEEKQAYKAEILSHIALGKKNTQDMTSYLNGNLKKTPTYDKAMKVEQEITSRPGK